MSWVARDRASPRSYNPWFAAHARQGHRAPDATRSTAEAGLWFQFREGVGFGLSVRHLPPLGPPSFICPLLIVAVPSVFPTAAQKRFWQREFTPRLSTLTETWLRGSACDDLFPIIAFGTCHFRSSSWPVVFATCPPQIGTTSTQFPVGAISGSRDGGNYEADHFFRAASRRRAMPSPASENTQRPRTPSEPCWPRSVIDWDADFLLKWPMWLDWTRGRSRRARSSQTPPSAYGGTSCV